MQVLWGILRPVDHRLFALDAFRCTLIYDGTNKQRSDATKMDTRQFSNELIKLVFILVEQVCRSVCLQCTLFDKSLVTSSVAAFIFLVLLPRTGKMKCNALDIDMVQSSFHRTQELCAVLYQHDNDNDDDDDDKWRSCQCGDRTKGQIPYTILHHTNSVEKCEWWCPNDISIWLLVYKCTTHNCDVHFLRSVGRFWRVTW